MRLLLRTAAGLTCLLLVTACESESRNTSTTEFETTDDGTGLIEPGFRTVLRVDMRPGSANEDSRALQEKYIKFSGVQEVGGGDTIDTLIIFKPEVTKDQVVKVRQALSDESSVEQVNVEHRK